MIEFARYGRGDRKLLGLHGWFGNEHSFRPLELSLGSAEVDCAWLAHRGYGLSLDVEGRYDMAEMAADALAVADRLGWARFSVIGHSMGGKAAQLVAAHAPDRVEKLILVAPVSADAVPFDPPVRAMFDGAVDSADGRAAVVDGSTGNRLSRTWVDDVVATSMDRTRKEAFAGYLRSWADDDFVDVVKEVAVETLVVTGAQDPVITAAICEQVFATRFHNLAIKELQSSGHYPIDEVPLLLGALVAGHLGR